MVNCPIPAPCQLVLFAKAASRNIPGRTRFFSVSMPTTPGPELMRRICASSRACWPLAAQRRSCLSYFFSLEVGPCSGGGVVAAMAGEGGCEKERHKRRSGTVQMSRSCCLARVVSQRWSSLARHPCRRAGQFPTRRRSGRPSSSHKAALGRGVCGSLMTRTTFCHDIIRGLAEISSLCLLKLPCVPVFRICRLLAH